MIMYYYILHTIVFLMSYIPVPIGQFLGKILGITAFIIPIKRNMIAYDNIQQSFGDSMEQHEIKRLYRQVLVHFGQMLFEVPHILSMKLAYAKSQSLNFMNVPGVFVDACNH